MVAWIVSSFLVILGLFWMYAERDLFRDGLRSYRWARTRGRIIDKEDRSFLLPGLVGSAAIGVGDVEFRETGYFYEYQVGLTRYVSDVYCFGVHMDKEVANYIVGDYVPVYYDPAEPRRSVLRRGVQLGTMASTVPAIVGVASLIWMLCA